MTRVRYLGNAPAVLVVGDKELVAGGPAVDLDADELASAEAAAPGELIRATDAAEEDDDG